MTWGFTEYKAVELCFVAVAEGLLDGPGDTVTGCGKDSAAVGEAAREVRKLYEGHAGLSLLSPHLRDCIILFPSQILSLKSHRCPAFQCSPLAYADVVADGCHARGNHHSWLWAWGGP